MKYVAEQRDRRARRLMRKGVQSFLCEAKKEMKLLLAHVIDLPGSGVNKSDGNRSRKKSKHLTKEADDDELTQLTKRLKLK